jgi:threonine/homoserine/homoserine lactone efflux protein
VQLDRRIVDCMSSLLDTRLLLSFCMTAAVIVVMPGPSVMFIVSRALAVGRPAAIAAAAGNSLGATFQGLLAAFGVGSLIAESDLLYNIIKFGGAIYLVSVGAKTLRHREFAAPDGAVEASTSRQGAELRQGFMVGATNPKTIVFFAAALPQFVDRDRGFVIVQMLLLLAVYGGMSWFSDTSWGVAGGSMRRWCAASPQRIERLIGIGGCCIIAVGAWMALSHGAA